MSRHVVAAAADFPPGTRRLVEIDGRAIVIFNVKGEYFALLNRCPHNGGPLVEGVITGLVQSAGPGDYTYTREGEIIRCPWHGWEFDIKTGKSFCTAIRARARPFPVHLAPGATLVEGPFRAETVPVRVEADYVVVEV